MDFLGIGMAEILLILVVAMIVWGPHKIVEIGKAVGKMAHSLRKVTFDLTQQVSKEIEEGEEGQGHEPPR